MKLSVREEQILVLVCEGFDRYEIADMMSKSHHTIANHLRSIRFKTDCHKVASMVMWAVAHDLIDPKKYYGPSVTVTKSPTSKGCKTLHIAA